MILNLALSLVSLGAFTPSVPIQDYSYSLRGQYNSCYDFLQEDSGDYYYHRVFYDFYFQINYNSIDEFEFYIYKVSTSIESYINESYDDTYYIGELTLNNVIPITQNAEADIVNVLDSGNEEFACTMYINGSQVTLSGAFPYVLNYTPLFYNCNISLYNAWTFAPTYISSQAFADGTYNAGYNVGYTQGYNDGYNVGNSNGYSQGYQEGYSEGFTEGSTQDETAVAIFSGMVNVGLIPVNFFLSIFNFEVFGINISAMVSAFLTIAIIVIIVRMVTGKKND